MSRLAQMGPFPIHREHLKRIDEAAQYVGMNRKMFIINTALAEAAEIEEQRRNKSFRVSHTHKQLPKENEAEETVIGPPDTDGLGLSGGLKPTETPPSSNLLLPAQALPKDEAAKNDDPLSRLAALLVEKIKNSDEKKAEDKPSFLSRLSRLLP